MKSIVNAAPGIVNYGVQDLSGAQYTRAPEELPQHLPKFLIYAQSGPDSEELLGGADRILMYGDQTFAERSAYFNHQTFVSNIVNKQGNVAMYKRLIPTDAGPKPTICVYLDVLETTVDIYKRNEDGSIATDVAGDPVVLSQAAGHRVKFVVKNYTTPEEAQSFGALTITTGDQTDAAGNQSKRYPIFEQEHSFIGKNGNLAGIRLWAVNETNVSQLPSKLMAKRKCYPFMYSVIRKNEETGTSKFVGSVFGEQQISVVFKPDVVDPVTEVRLYFGERAVGSYQSLTDTRYAKKYGEFGRVHVYQDNVDLLLKKFQAAEAPFLTDKSDMTANVEDMYLFNFVTGQDTTASPYHSYVFADASNSVRFSQSTNVFAAGGSDGTMSQEKYAALVSEYMDRYLDEADELHDIAYHVESHMYDSGVPLSAKYKLINFIGVRKDTFVHLTPFEVGQAALSAAEEYSVAAALYSRAALYPDSTYFGTSVFRAMIMGNSGLVRGSTVVDRIPITYEVAAKSAKYMGASNGQWKNGENFDGYPGSILENMYDLSIRWTPDDVRNRNWDVGLNWVQRYDRTQFFFPAMKTVYDDDTSVLTSYITACGIITLHKILNKVHRTMSGVSGLTEDQFSKKVNDFIVDACQGIFDGRFIIVPKCQFTSMDQVRNYSWTVPVDFYAPGMKTVMTTYITSRRIEDYSAA